MQDSPIVLTTLAGLSTGLGGLLAVLCPPSERLLAASAGFAGGVMLTASLADLMPEALAFYGGYLPPLACGGAVVSLLALGMLTAGLLGRSCTGRPLWQKRRPGPRRGHAHGTCHGAGAAAA